MWTNAISDPHQNPVGLGFTDDKIRFIWLTDSHITTPASSVDTAMRKAIADCNAWKPNALIHTGDIGNSFEAMTLRGWYNLRSCQRPIITITGNHDEVEAVECELNTAALTARNAWNMQPPFFVTSRLVSGDGTISALVIGLDCNYYNDNRSGCHQIGDRVGISAVDPTGGYRRQLGTEQINLTQAALAASDDDFIIIATHYPPSFSGVVDESSVADLLQADGRPAIGLCGHNHGHAYTHLLTSSDELKTYTFYKCPAMYESGCYVRVVLGLSGGTVTVDSMEIKNYTDPGGWTIGSPFTLAS